MFCHCQLFLPRFRYDYIILNKSRFILKGLHYHLVLFLDISDHPSKNWKIKLYHAVGSFVTEEHRLKSFRGEFWG